MKNLYLIFLLFCGVVQSQIINIPDANFKNKLLEASPSNTIAKDQFGNNITIDTNSDGEIQESEALEVYELRVIVSFIADLTGIEGFTNLTLLNVEENLITEIDLSNNVNLEYVDVSYNQLSILDFSNNPNLEFFQAFFNLDLLHVNVKNGTAFDLDIIDLGNWMEIWGNLPSHAYVCADDFEIEDIEPYLNLWGTEGKHVSSYCTFYPGGDYNTITGTLIFDSNNDGVCDEDDLPQEFVKIDITDGTEHHSSFADENGNYVFYTQEGTYTLTPDIENPSFFIISPESEDVFFPVVDNSVEEVNFCIIPNGTHPDLEVVLTPIGGAVAGFQAYYKIVYRNKGNIVLSQPDGVSLTFQDDYMDLIMANPAPDSVSEGLLSWDFVDLMPFEHRVIYLGMQLNSPMHPEFPLNIDDELGFEAQILPIVGDDFPEDNTYELTQIVVNSYDPNDITCLEGDVVPVDHIGEELHYVIRFENTGNYPAQNIVVTMEIDPTKFEVSSLKLLEASHIVKARVVGTMAEFFFEDIQLNSGGHGNILLVMNSVPSLSEGDSVSTQANIYFDYNYPVTTNEATTVFSDYIGIEDNILRSKITVFPNPVSNEIWVTSQTKIKHIEWFDMHGRLLQVSLIHDFSTKINTSSYQSGMYFARIHTEEGIVTHKIIRE